MAGGTIADAFVNVALDGSQIQSQLSKLGGGLEGRFGKLGKLSGLAMKAGIAGAVVGTAYTVGKELYAVGARFDEMADTIRGSTGKTGKDLDGLVSDAKAVATHVPASFEDAGKAVALLSTRTGLTGKPLQALSEQMLELSRLTGTDLTKNLDSVTRMLGDAGFTGAKASKGIDELFRASQASGVEFGRLSDLMTKFGGPMRQLGFSFEQEAALLAKFEKEGVNTELVMGSMRIALGKMAKAGKDPQRELRKTMNVIKNTGDAGVANAKSIELFGARAGPDMAAAIREGRFSIGDLMKTIKSGHDTVIGAGKDTADLSEQWLMFKNKVLVAISPLAEKFFTALGQGMAYLNKVVPPLVDNLGRKLGPTVKDLIEIFNALRPVLEVVFKVGIAVVREFANEVEAMAKIVGGIIEIIAGLLTGDWAQAWDGAKKVVGGFAQLVEGQLRLVLNVFSALTAPFREGAAKLGHAIVDGVVGAIAGIGNEIRAEVTGAVTFGETILGTLSARASTLGQRIVSAVVNGLTGIGDDVRERITNAITFGETILGTIAERALAIGRRIVSAAVNGVANIGDAIREAVSNVVHFGADFVSNIAGRAVQLGVAIKNRIVDGLSGLAGEIYNVVRSMITDAINRLKGIGGFFGRAARGVVGKVSGGHAVGVVSPSVGTLAEGDTSGGVAGPTPTRRLRIPTMRLGDFVQAPTLVRVYIGDEELRGIVRTEVDVTNDLTARVLLAGAR